MRRFRSGAPSVHHTGPRSPSATFAASTRCRAASRATGSPARIAAPFARRAAISSRVNAARTSAGNAGFVQRHNRPRTAKYRPSGVTGGPGLSAELSPARPAAR